MKRIYQLAVVAAVLVAPFVVDVPASAQSVDNTGPGSSNEIDEEQNYTCEVENENTVVINGETVQVSTSGDANNEGNTEGGSSTTGSATNSSGTNFNVTITNGETCVAAVVPEPETPEEPEEPTPGAGETVQPTQTATPTALPVTSGETAPMIFLLSGLAVLGGLAVAYRRLF